VEILDTVDAAIQQTEALIVKFKQLSDGLLRDLLTFGLDANGQLRDPAGHADQFRCSPLGPVPVDWETATLGECCFVTKLAGYEYTKYFDYEQQGEIIAVRVLNIRNGNLDLSHIQTIPRYISEKLPRSVLRE
jgi:type I restriction enzyme, S subunit